MPLHDWTEEKGWDSVHFLWLAHLLPWIKPRLPANYRAFVGSVPALLLDSTGERPDMAVRQWYPETPAEPSSQQALPLASDAVLEEPDVEVATVTLDPQKAIFIATEGKMVAALELVSPRNKDQPSARSHYLYRYLSYLQEGAHLVLIDVLPRPRSFSFADALAAEVQIVQPRTPPPLPSPIASASPLPREADCWPSGAAR
jgi:hypothetical protein